MVSRRNAEALLAASRERLSDPEYVEKRIAELEAENATTKSPATREVQQYFIDQFKEHLESLKRQTE